MFQSIWNHLRSPYIAALKHTPHLLATFLGIQVTALIAVKALQIKAKNVSLQV